MARILTGIQSTGVPHMGNILGAIRPGIELSRDPQNECFFFIADLHSLTTVKDPELLQHNTYATAAGWLACGFDTKSGFFYRQSDIPEVTELTWYLNCFTPFPMLSNAHSFKDKSDRIHEVNSALFTYPVLMAADILLYDAEVIPVGKDQVQHIEITRDIAGAFNHAYGETLVMPKHQIDKEVMIVPGIDGQKMSKSYGNEIILFLDDKKLRKRVMKIVTDSTPKEEPKNPDTCNVVALYKLVATATEVEEMRKLYQGGNFGYGDAKQLLYEVLVREFKTERETYANYMNDLSALDAKLQEGAEKAGVIAYETLGRVREKIGYKKFAYYDHKL